MHFGAQHYGKVTYRTIPLGPDPRVRPFPWVYKATRNPLPSNIRSAPRHSFVLAMWLFILAGECNTSHILWRGIKTKFLRLLPQKQFVLFVLLRPLMISYYRPCLTVENTMRSVRATRVCFSYETKRNETSVQILCEKDLLSNSIQEFICKKFFKAYILDCSIARRANYEKIAIYIWLTLFYESNFNVSMFNQILKV